VRSYAIGIWEIATASPMKTAIFPFGRGAKTEFGRAVVIDSFAAFVSAFAL
jgi:hypothetical protein